MPGVSIRHGRHGFLRKKHGICLKNPRKSASSVLSAANSNLRVAILTFEGSEESVSLADLLDGLEEEREKTTPSQH